MLGLWKLYFHPISVLKLVIVTQPQVAGDLDDIPRAMSGPLFVPISAQQERVAVEDPAWNNADRYLAVVLISFEADDIGGQ